MMRERFTQAPFKAACLLSLLGCLLLVFAAAVSAAEDEGSVYKTYGAEEARKIAAERGKHWITADHSKHAALQQEFTSGPEVTKACLSCHNEAAMQVHQTIHWTWLCPHDPTQRMGKYGLSINNFCIAVPSNEPRCTSCHVGYGFKDKDFDFNDPTRVDCLVCHEQTGTYKKFPSGAGNPVSEPKKFGGKKMFYPPDWNKVAQSVGRPNRLNCGGCHFNGGGGDGVKHGDLDSSLLEPSKELDVHMSKDGAGFDCVRCHTTEAHSIAGRCYKHPAAEDPTKSLIEDDQISRITCYSCHTDKPHKPGSKLNDHTDKVACQACHIPEFAREKPTKMWWDWSQAGKLKDGKPYTEDGPLGKHSYDSKKGDFKWAKNVQPEYFWYNGTMDYILLTDTIDPTKVVNVNTVVGEPNGENSRIFPFKVHRGKTPYDAGTNKMVVPHLFGKDKDAYWKNFDWEKALAHGIEYWREQYKDIEAFSGEVGFVETAYHYQTTHMVAPAENSLECDACHSKNGRLANIASVYMPGRDANKWLNIAGWILVFGSLLGVLGHGFLRIVSRR